MVGAVAGTSPWSNDRLDAWSFVRAGDRDRLVDEGALPWFTARDFKYELWRPLSSAVLYATHAVAGPTRWPYQLVLGLVYVLFVLAVGAIYALTLPRAAAIAGVLAFAVASSHVEVIYWLAAIHYLLAGALVAASLALRIRGRPLLSLALLAFGLLAGEAAFAAAGFVVAWELARSGRPFRARLRAAAVPALVCVAYLLLYKLAGKGIAGEGLHVDPFEHPREFLASAVHNTTLYATTLFGAGRDWRLAGVAVLVVGLGVLWIRGDAARRQRIAFYALGTAFSLLPMAANEYSYRTLVIPSIGAIALVVLFVVECLAERRALAVAAAVLVVAQQGVAHARTGVELYRKRVSWSVRQPFLVASADALAGKDVFVVGGGDFLYGQLGGHWLRRMTGRAPRAWYALATGDGPLEIRRVDDDTLELAVPPEPPFFRSALDPLHAGDRVVTRAYTVTVLEVAGGQARRIRVDLARPIDPARDVFLSLAPAPGAPFGRLVAP